VRTDISVSLDDEEEPRDPRRLFDLSTNYTYAKERVFKPSGVRPVKPRAPGASVSTRSGTDLGFCVRESMRAGMAGLLGPPDLCGEAGAIPWTLAASVPQAGIDYDAWSRHRGNPHAYPPLCTGKIHPVGPVGCSQNGISVALAILWRMRGGVHQLRTVAPGYGR